MKITTKRFHHQGVEDIQFSYDVNVSNSGTFYTYLPQGAVDKLTSYGLTLPAGVKGKRGYFDATTMDGLEDNIKRFIQEAVSRELVKTIDIIEYQFSIGALYCKNTSDANDTHLYPNGSGLHDKYLWQQGTVDSKDNSLTVYARPRTHMIYRYASGKEVIENYPIDPTDYPPDSAVNFLNSLISNPNLYQPMKTLPCTEANANFLKSAILAIWNINEALGKAIKDDTLETILDTTPITIHTTVDYGNN